MVSWATWLALAVVAGAFTYPPARRSDQIDTYFGEKVADPYRWLEDADSPETRAWVTAENQLTFAYLDKIPQREPIRRRLTALYQYERFAAPLLVNGRYFYSRNTGLQNQNIIFVQDGIHAAPRMLIDPNTLSSDGTAAVDGFAVNHNASLVAYAVAQAGSDWSTWKIRDITTGQDRPDTLQWTKFSTIGWTPDGTGLYYARFPEPRPGADLTQASENQKVYFHKLGDPQSQDRLIYERPDEKHLMFAPYVTEDGRYLILFTSTGASDDNGVLYRDLKDTQGKLMPLIEPIEAKYDLLGNEGSHFYFFSTKAAPLGRVIDIDVTHPEASAWRVVVPEQPETLHQAAYADGRFFLSFLKDAHSTARVYGRDGKLQREISMPGLGTADLATSRQGQKEILFTYTDFLTPLSLYRYDLETGRTILFRGSHLNFDPGQFESRQAFYKSKDGTRIPMFMIYRKGLKLNGQNPTLLYGYGGFNIPLLPGFQARVITWLEMGGVYVVANLRGGSEYGEAWHQAGIKQRKQNVFDDFIAAAEYLIDQHVTSTPKLAIDGRSNGGLLVGAVLNQRPDLFGAALPGVGVMDMLRFQKFTIGGAWTSDYGSSDNADEYPALRAYSPLHNIHHVKYPPTFIVTADHDDRVVPGHSFKYAAELQHEQAGDAPILIRIETRAGHGGGKPVSKIIDEATDQFAFLAKALGMNPPQKHS